MICMFQVFFETPKRGHASSVSASIVLYCATSHCLYSLSSAETSFCSREAGEKKKRERAGNIVHRALSIFFSIIAIITVI